MISNLMVVDLFFSPSLSAAVVRGPLDNPMGGAVLGISRVNSSQSIMYGEGNPKGFLSYGPTLQATSLPGRSSRKLRELHVDVEDKLVMWSSLRVGCVDLNKQKYSNLISHNSTGSKLGERIREQQSLIEKSKILSRTSGKACIPADRLTFTACNEDPSEWFKQPRNYKQCLHAGKLRF